MRGSINVLAVSCLLLSLVQGVVSQGGVTTAAAAAAAPAAAPAAAAAPVSADGSCPNVTLKSLKIYCEVSEGGVVKPSPCGKPGSTVRVNWRKNSLKNTNIGAEIECQAPGVWKIKAKKIEEKAGYTVVAGIGAFKAVKDKKSWTDAEDICIKDGGHLVVIDSEEEYKQIKALVVPFAPLDSIHIGVQDREVEGTFLTLLGAPFKLQTYLPWSKGKPSTFGSDDCVAVNVTSSEISDIRCGSHSLPFVCEIFQAP